MTQSKGFVLPNSLEPIVAKLSDKQAGTLFKAVLKYAALGQEPIGLEDGMVAVAFDFVRRDLDYTNAKYQATCEKRRAAVQKRWESESIQKYTNVYKCINQDTNVYKAIHKKKNENEKKNTHTSINASESNNKKHFIKPTLEEVQAYCKERNNAVNAQTFVDFYESKGWKIGATPMKDWRAAVRTWERRENNGGNYGADYNRNPDPGKYAGFGRKIEELGD